MGLGPQSWSSSSSADPQGNRLLPAGHAFCLPATPIRLPTWTLVPRQGVGCVEDGLLVA